MNIVVISPLTLIPLVSSSIHPFFLFAGQSEGSGLTETDHTNEGTSDLLNNDDSNSNSKNFRSSPGATPHLKANQFDIYPYCSILANENWMYEKVFVFWFISTFLIMKPEK